MNSGNRTRSLLKGGLIGIVVTLMLWPQVGAAADRAKGAAPAKPQPRPVPSGTSRM